MSRTLWFFKTVGKEKYIILMGCVSQSSNSQFLVNTCTVIDLLNKSPLGEYFLCIKKCPVQKSGSGIRYIFRSMSGSKFTVLIAHYKSSTSSHLKEHKRTHIGEKQFNCSQWYYKCSTFVWAQAIKIYSSFYPTHTITAHHQCSNFSWQQLIWGKAWFLRPFWLTGPSKPVRFLLQ